MRYFRESKALTADRDAPLRGTPAVRRVKNYAAATGYTWNYVYEGYRMDPEPTPHRAYVFTLSSGDLPSRRVFVVLPDAVLDSLALYAEREVLARESYALAKMHLFAVLDDEARPEPGARYTVGPEAALAIWEELDL